MYVRIARGALGFRVQGNSSACSGVARRAGGQAGLPLPYRGQAEAVMPSAAELEGVPEGPPRSVLLRSRMVRGVCSPHAPMPHAGLGLPGYVQVP